MAVVLVVVLPVAADWAVVLSLYVVVLLLSEEVVAVVPVVVVVLPVAADWPVVLSF